jgi:hypothetical protein
VTGSAPVDGISSSECRALPTLSADVVREEGAELCEPSQLVIVEL